MARASRKKKNEIENQNDISVRTWKTALYVRLSVEDNGKDSDSIENQTSLLEEYVTDHCYLIKTAIFTDNGYTGTDFMRPNFTRLMESVQAGKIDCIVVKDLSRLGRNYIETSQFIEKICPFYGLRFISINDGFDTEDAASKDQLSVALTNIINDYYAKDISRKVTTALQSKMVRGEFIANYAPHGYCKAPENKNYLIVDPEAAKVIRQIFEWRSEGVSYMGINKRLNDAGIPSPGQYRLDHGIETHNNKKNRVILWNKHVVTEILNNMVYIGHLAQRKGSKCLYAGIPFHRTEKDEWIVVRDTHEPLISEEVFDKVQKINAAAAEKTKANAGKYDYLPKEKNIYGKRFTCGECGAVMKLHRSFSTKKDKAYFTFKCPTFAEHGARGCSDIKMRKADLDASVLSFIRTQMEVFIDMENTLDKVLAMKNMQIKQADIQQDIRSLRQKLAHKQSILSGLYIDYRDALLSEKEYVYQKEAVVSDIAIIENNLKDLEQRIIDVEEQKKAGQKWKNMIEQFYEASKISVEMADAFIEKMVLHADGSLDIKLSYTDELKMLLDTCERIRMEVA